MLSACIFSVVNYIMWSISKETDPAEDSNSKQWTMKNSAELETLLILTASQINLIPNSFVFRRRPIKSSTFRRIGADNIRGFTVAQQWRESFSSTVWKHTQERKVHCPKKQTKAIFLADSSSFRGRKVSLTETTVPHLVDSERESNQSSAGTGAKANELKECFEKSKNSARPSFGSRGNWDPWMSKQVPAETDWNYRRQEECDCVRSTVWTRQASTWCLIKQWKWLNLLGLVPYQRPPPKHYTGGTSQHIPKRPKEYFRAEYYKTLDCVDVQFEVRFNRPELRISQELEDVLVTGEVSEIVGQYPELNINSRKVQLSMFRSKHKIQSTADVTDLMREMPVEVRQKLF